MKKVLSVFCILWGSEVKKVAKGAAGSYESKLAEGLSDGGQVGLLPSLPDKEMGGIG